MIRTETIGDAVLYLGDCREILPTLPRVDAVVTDPPYLGLSGGLQFINGGVAPKSSAVNLAIGDEWEANLDWVLPAWERCAGAFMVFCTHHGLAETQAAVPKKPVGLLTWHKRNAPAHPANLPRWTEEYVWLWQNGGCVNWRVFGDTLIDEPKLASGCMATERILNNAGKAAHPTQKPVAVMAQLIEACGETILDPFMGSGTTGVACIKLGRKFIGIEIEPKYFDIACKRIEEAWKQPRLFEEPREKVEQGKLGL